MRWAGSWKAETVYENQYWQAMECLIMIMANPKLLVIIEDTGF
jgi:hypothetical protein